MPSPDAYTNAFVRLARAGDFEGKGGPEDKVKMDSIRRPGDDDTLNLQDMKREGIDKLQA